MGLKQSQERQTKDLRLQGGMIPNQNYAQTRVVHVLSGQNQNLEFNNIATSEISIIDSVQKVFDVLIH